MVEGQGVFNLPSNVNLEMYWIRFWYFFILKKYVKKGSVIVMLWFSEA